MQEEKSLPISSDSAVLAVACFQHSGEGTGDGGEMWPAKQ